jgi:NADPH-dependent 2,4-dienoyl-CoA reductase/sulfur reductase-like enzyme
MGDKKAKIVIAGGGFAGMYAAMYFDKRLARRSEAEVVLISRENFILFTPMLHEVAAGDLQPTDIVNPLRRILRHVTVVEAEVDAIDLHGRKVSCVGGLRNVRREFEFDHLLLALGAETDFFDIAGVREWRGDDEDPRGRRPAPQHDGCTAGDGDAPRERISSPPVADVRHCWRRLCRRRDDGRRQRFCP